MSPTRVTRAVHRFVTRLNPTSTAWWSKQRRQESPLEHIRRLRDVLAPLGFTVVRRANPRDVRAALELMWPVETQHALIRIGSRHDGGYLVPDDLEGIRACFSPGVSDVADFELDLARRGIPCFLADASVASSPIVHELLHFESLWLGPHDDPATNTISLDTWVTQNAPAKGPGGDTEPGDLLLQMDIEDAEWATLAAASDETLARFRIIVIECHDLESLTTRKGLEYMGSVFTKLSRQFSVVHAHPNNYSEVEVMGSLRIHPIMEYTLLRRDRITNSVPAVTFPHPLDARNVKGKPNVVLNRPWYATSPQ